MGTSKSVAGPADKRKLLPSWATDPLDPVPPTTPPGGVVPQSPVSPQPSPAIPSPAISPPKPATPWKVARTRIGKVASGGGGGGRMASAASANVRALGGSRKAATAAKSGRTASVRLGGFLAEVGSRGFAEAAREFGLASVIGKGPESIIAAVCDAISPEGSTRDEAAARGAMYDSLMPLYDKIVQASNAPDQTGIVTAEDVRSAVQLSIVAYIYHQWLRDVGKQFETKGISAEVAVRRERDVKRYVKESVALDLQGIDTLSAEWQSKRCRDFIKMKFEEAYRVFEET